MNGMPRICRHTIFICGNPQRYRKPLKQRGFLPRSGGHSSSNWCQQGQVPRLGMRAATGVVVMMAKLRTHSPADERQLSQSPRQRHKPAVCERDRSWRESITRPVSAGPIRPTGPAPQGLVPILTAGRITDDQRPSRRQIQASAGRPLSVVLPQRSRLTTMLRPCSSPT